MALRKVEQVKADKGFKIWDLIIYGAVIVIVAVLFITIFAVRDTSPFRGIRVVYVNDVIYEYDFENGREVSRNEKYVEITENDDGKLILKVNTGGGDYNVIQINKNGSVKMIEANCGKKDCVYTPELKDNNGIIYCSPHRLKIIPYDFDIDDGKIII